MDWDDLRYLLELSRGGSFAEAGRRLGVSHTTVARRIRELSADANVELIEPGPEGILLTAAGERAVATAEAIERSTIELGRSFEAGPSVEGTVRVTTTDLLATLLAPQLASFAERFPGVQLEIAVGEGLRDLSRREADVALRVARASPPDHLWGRRLGAVGFALYAAKGRPRDRAPSEIAWTQQAEGSTARARTGSALVMLALCRAGLGSAWLPCVVADEDPRLERIAEPPAELALHLWVLTHADLRRVGRVRAFLDHVRDHVAPLSAALAGAR